MGACIVPVPGKGQGKKVSFFFCATSEWKGGRGRAENGAREGRKEVGKKGGGGGTGNKGGTTVYSRATPSYAGYTDRVKEKYLPEKRGGKKASGSKVKRERES